MCEYVVFFVDTLISWSMLAEFPFYFITKWNVYVRAYAVVVVTHIRMLMPALFFFFFPFFFLIGNLCMLQVI